ncbi:hypothetical protein T01_13130 [Trichinella spiralis]|uniref:Uncharacterized protein n=1 Tax=Trichinella spiralis TaxID=6334 RepID=A0A0V1BE88_TRISP|nr:hypothetical protein T01_13130 [Trichinella spiralis]
MQQAKEKHRCVNTSPDKAALGSQGQKELFASVEQMDVRGQEGYHRWRLQGKGRPMATPTKWIFSGYNVKPTNKHAEARGLVGISLANKSTAWNKWFHDANSTSPEAVIYWIVLAKLRCNPDVLASTLAPGCCYSICEMENCHTMGEEKAKHIPQSTLCNKNGRRFEKEPNLDHDKDRPINSDGNFRNVPNAAANLDLLEASPGAFSRQATNQPTSTGKGTT